MSRRRGASGESIPLPIRSAGRSTWWRGRPWCGRVGENTVFTKFLEIKRAEWDQYRWRYEYEIAKYLPLLWRERQSRRLDAAQALS